MLLKISSAILLCVLIQGALNQQQQARFHVIREWKYINFTWPNEDVLQSATARGLYIPENIVLSGVTYFSDYYYLTLARMKEGVPATLVRIPENAAGNTAPLLEPFPTWGFNVLGNCDALQNVQNVEVDEKGQMWIIDGGHTNTLARNPDYTCPPKLIIFDIQNNRTITKHIFSDAVTHRNASFLYDLVVDGTYAYITDNSVEDPGIVVFFLNENRSWKIRHSKSMRADPTTAQFRVNGVSISAPINIAGIALGPKVRSSNQQLQLSSDREVFYSALSSLHLYSISTSVLRDENYSNNGEDYPGEVKDVGMKASQTDGMYMDNKGVLFFGLLGTNSIAQWDSHSPFASGQKLISKDPVYIQWTNGFTIDDRGNVTVLTNRLQKFIYDKLNLSEPNFWILAAHTGSVGYVHDDQSYNYQIENDERQGNITGSFGSDPAPQPIPHASAAPKVEAEVKTNVVDVGSGKSLDVASVFLVGVIATFALCWS